MPIKQNKIINDDFRKLILLYINNYEIKKKMNNSLIQNYNDNNNIDIKENYYYLLNFNLFKKFLEINNINNILNYLINDNIIEKINNFDNLSLEQKISQILSYLNEDMIKQINNNKSNYKELQNFNLININSQYIKINSTKLISYYYNFILIKEEIYQLFIKDLINNYINSPILCLIGEKKNIFSYKNTKSIYN